MDVFEGAHGKREGEKSSKGFEVENAP